MAYKCRVCGANEVDHPGDICELCAIGQDPYVSVMQNGHDNSASNQGIFQPKSSIESSTGSTNVYVPGRGKSRKILLGGDATFNNTDPYGNSIVPQKDNVVQVYQAGQVPVSASTTDQTTADVESGENSNDSGVATIGKNDPLTSGITKNIIVDVQKISTLRKLFRTLFCGVPFTLDNDITMFQVFPDYTGTSLNAMGNACDQVIVYGKLNAGAVAENNDVEVYGHRDSDNNIVAKKIVNKASGTTATADRVIPTSVIWLITVIVFAALAFFVATYGVVGIVWAVILIICLTNLPLIFKIIAGIFGIIFSMKRRR